MALIGLAVGVVAGLVQFWLLSRFSRLVTQGKAGAVTYALGLLQFLLPLFVLAAVGLLRRQDLLLAGTGIAGILMLGAIARYVSSARKNRKGGDK